ncbi:Smr/MutS family protein [Arenimonas sp. MALMAid1274]|uniref:Smr/MutS family protein n=1 Tax=Arenimonas sp. MALMAid1274 TaxID=3411630 RepID=UPI003B9E254B
MKRKPPTVSDEDAALFRESIDGVRPLPAPPPPPERPRPAPEPRMQARDEAEALAQSRSPALMQATIDAAEALSYRRDEVPEAVLKTLRRGGYSLGGELDLHHLRAVEAERWLRNFLHESRAGGHACVRIIHGKGPRGDDGGSVLKALVDRMLRQRADVLAFASAPEAMGGTGAVLVLLARRRAGEQGRPA